MIYMPPRLGKHLWVNFDFSETCWKTLLYPQVIHFYKPKKGLSSAVSTTKTLVTEIFDCLGK